MCSSCLRQLYLLLWKNILLHKRKWLVTCLEIVIPTFFALILVYIRSRVSAEEIRNPVIWKPFTMEDVPAGLHHNVIDTPTPRNEWTVAYAPNSTVTDRIMKTVLTATGRLIYAYGFETEEKMIEYLLNKSTRGKFESDALGGIVFSSFNVTIDKVPSNVTYKIRLPYSPREDNGMSFGNYVGDPNWMTQYTYPGIQKVGPREGGNRAGGIPGYHREGFLTLQHQLDRAIIKELEAQSGHTNHLVDVIDVKLQRIPYPPYLKDLVYLVIQQELPLIIMLGYVFASLNIVKNVVHEKEMKLKETMKMMGLHSWLHWTAWFLTYVVLLIASVAVVIFIFFVSLTFNGRVITYSDPSLVFVFLSIYVCALIFFCFAVSVFFKKSRSGAAAGGLLFLLTYLPYFFIQPRYHSLSLRGKIALSLVPNIAMAFGCQIIGMYEGTEAGVQWSNVAQGVSVDDTFTLMHVMGMLLVDCVIGMIIAWYVEAVMPGEFGLPRPWYFPVTRSYWLGPQLEQPELDPTRVGASAAAATTIPVTAAPGPSTSRSMEARGATAGPSCDERTPLLRRESPTMNSSGGTSDSTTCEPEPSHRRCSVSLRGVTKRYGRGAKAKVAVNSLNLNIYEGQITALLGHNGAGKTTTMSMITGFLPPTHGRILVDGMDIRRDITAVRRQLGLCPQHDILFEQLTIDEHLRFFAKLKSCRAELVEEEVERMLIATGLASRRHSRANTLSGGTRRKLSVAIALIGGSRIIILDEPTSGMDPGARRELWSFLQLERTNRTILLSTHFMEEADVLGDRIAIMANGVVQCCGSSLFLKSRYGAGYHLTMVKSAKCSVQDVMELILELVPNARPESNVSDELSVILPTESSGAFESLFTKIEERREELGILSYGASVTTMEEVFLKVGDSEDPVNLPEEPRTYGTSRSSSFASSINIAGTSTGSVNDVETISEARSVYEEEHNQGAVLILQQFWAIFLKRFILSRRNIAITLIQLLVPIICTVIGLVVLRTWPRAGDSIPLTLNLDKYGPQVVTYGQPYNASMDDYSTKVVDAYQRQFYTKSNIRLLFMDDEPNFKKEGYIDYLWHFAQKDIARFNRENIIGAYFNPLNKNNLQTVALFNNQPYHSPPIALNAISNAILRASLGADYSITVVNHPQPRKVTDKIRDQYTNFTTGFTVAFTVVFGMAFLVSSFSVFLVRERSSKMKHLHFVSGTNKYVYWFATFTWDYINYLIPCACCVGVFAAFHVDAYSASPGRLIAIFALLALYGWAILPLMYLCSFVFEVPSTAMVWLTISNVLTGLGTLLTVNILQIPQLQLQHVAQSLEWAFLALFPNYNLGQGLFDFYTNYFFNKTCTEDLVEMICALGMNMTCCPGHCEPYCATWNANYIGWAPDGIGRMLVFLAAQGFVFLSICFISTTSVFAWLTNLVSPQRLRALHLMEQQQRLPRMEEDADVAQERHHLEVTPIYNLHERYSLELHEVTRYYGSRCAVDRLSCAIGPGECFGLLGVNGAGKSSTFKMLTGDLGLTNGDAFINGFSVRTQLRRVQRLLGYCPQHDALLDHLTGRETLVLFARLRGMHEELIPGEVEQLLSALLLHRYADRLVGTYSGGNKRKLSTAVALVGGPPVVCLDEPTTGMDPTARRHVWRALSHYRDRGRTLVLTSHSMEECEALCTKIAIMVNGQFKCFGSSQHLKDKFGRGYTLLVQVSYDDLSGINQYVDEFRRFIQENLPSAELKDVHQGLLHYHLHPAEGLTWASVFGLMEGNRVTLNIENYSVSQTTLEQVFLTFARAQNPPEISAHGLCFNPMRCCTQCNTNDRDASPPPSPPAPDVVNV